MGRIHAVRKCNGDSLKIFSILLLRSRFRHDGGLVMSAFAKS